MFNVSKIFIVNVGVNASHGNIRSPLFEDGTFVYMPIPENDLHQELPLPSYRSILPVSQHRFIPNKYLDKRVHYDPEFTTFTYGDSPTKSPRVANLKHVDFGDSIFFLARLVNWRDGAFTNDAGFYLIGFLEVEHIYKSSLASKDAGHLFRNNAHVLLEGHTQDSNNEFWVFKGSNKSALFKHAIPFTRAFADTVMRDRLGQPWKWDNKRSTLQVIGSYTRSCRILSEQEYIKQFWDYVETWN